MRPFAVNDSFTVTEDSLASASANQFNVLTNDIAHAGATLILKTFDTTGTQGTVTRVADILQFAPNADFNGTTTFTYVIDDTDGSGADSTGTVTVTVSEVNDASVGTYDDKTTNEDAALAFAASDLTSNDSKGASNEGGQTLTVSLPSGTTTLGGTVVLAGGQITYTPPANKNDLNGGPDKFVYQLTDNGTTAGVSTPLSATATVTISLKPVNDAPIASSDTATTAEDTALTIVGSTLTANDVPGPASATGCRT